MSGDLTRYAEVAATYLTASQDWAAGSVGRWIIYGVGLSVAALVVVLPVGFLLRLVVGPIFSFLVMVVLWFAIYVPLGVIPYLKDMQRQLEQSPHTAQSDHK